MTVAYATNAEYRSIRQYFQLSWCAWRILFGYDENEVFTIFLKTLIEISSLLKVSFETVSFFRYCTVLMAYTLPDNHLTRRMKKKFTYYGNVMKAQRLNVPFQYPSSLAYLFVWDIGVTNIGAHFTKHCFNSAMQIVRKKWPGWESTYIRGGK